MNYDNYSFLLLKICEILYRCGNKIHLCESIKNQSLLVNVYFDKKTPNETILRRNFTALIPLDDTLTVSRLRLIKKIMEYNTFKIPY